MVGMIFDFNGTLFADSVKQRIAWQHMAKKYSGRELTDEELQEHMGGRTNEHTLEYIVGHKLTTDEVDQLGKEKEQEYRLLCKDDELNFHLRRGVPEFLGALTAAGIPIALATASGRDNVNFFVESFGLDKWFSEDRIVFNDGSLRGKPNPDFFLEAAKRISLPTSKTVVFEDSSSGIAAAENAGAGWIVGVRTNDNWRWIESDKRLNTVISHFTDDNEFLTIERLQEL
jgi:HAD superfamily hydrolase (TIGR01509 family)